MKQALVTTTIQIPYNLEAYAKDIKAHGPEDTVIVVAGDQNAKGDILGFLTSKIAPHCPFVYLDVFEQIEFLDKLGAAEYKKFLPWSCIQRRNVAILYAYHNGAEVIGTIDDDNLWEGEKYFEQHGITGETQEIKVCTAGWINVCDGAVCKDGGQFYPRGFSFESRKQKEGFPPTETVTGRIVVNGGLWIGDPDVDAVTRLALAPDVQSYAAGKAFLGKNAKCPFNSQNTALHRDVIPAYCLATGVGRYDDIVASYVVSRIASHLGDYISFGRPIVNQVRNQHDLYKDLNDELLGMRLIDRIVDWLYGIALTGTTYKACIAELILEFEQQVNNWVAIENPPSDQVAFLRSLITNYRHWMAVT